MTVRSDTKETRRDRTAILKSMLERRQREILQNMQTRMGHVQAQHAPTEAQAVLDTAEASEMDLQTGIELALIGMEAETVSKIDRALANLAVGTYGHCHDCGTPIPARRLKALPFADRCQRCEAVRELVESSSAVDEPSMVM